MEFNDDRPIYVQIVEMIELDIISGKYKSNDKLPSVRELSARYRVNPNTMQRAFADLESAGLVYTERTNGRFVSSNKQIIAKRKEDTARAAVKDFLVYMQKLGIQEDVLIALVKDVRKGEEHEYCTNKECK